MQDVRSIKSADEIALLDHAAALVDGAYDELYRYLRAGVRENDCVALVNNYLYRHGSEEVEAVNSISGERCSPHPHVFSDRLLRPGDTAYFDIIHAFNGYRTCYYRTLNVGSQPSRSNAYGDAASTWTTRSWPDPARRLVGRCRPALPGRPGLRIRHRGRGVRAPVLPRLGPVELGSAR